MREFYNVVGLLEVPGPDIKQQGRVPSPGDEPFPGSVEPPRIHGAEVRIQLPDTALPFNATEAWVLGEVVVPEWELLDGGEEPDGFDPGPVTDEQGLREGQGSVLPAVHSDCQGSGDGHRGVPIR